MEDATIERMKRLAFVSALVVALGCEDAETCSGLNCDSLPGEDFRADVTAVQTSGNPGAYTFSVTVRSPDFGCDQYADWWEVLTPEGELLYRRVLAHSHVDEQPFTRSGGPVDLEESARVVVRAHMNNGGYGGTAFTGSVGSGFSAGPSLTAAFAPALSEVSPLPIECAF